MDIKKVVDLLPESVKYDTMNFEDVMLKDGRLAMRVTMCRLLADDELATMRGKHQRGRAQHHGGAAELPRWHALRRRQWLRPPAWQFPYRRRFS